MEINLNSLPFDLHKSKGVCFLSLITQFVGPNAACTKFGVSKCRIIIKNWKFLKACAHRLEFSLNWYWIQNIFQSSDAKKPKLHFFKQLIKTLVPSLLCLPGGFIKHLLPCIKNRVQNWTIKILIIYLGWWRGQTWINLVEKEEVGSSYPYKTLWEV